MAKKKAPSKPPSSGNANRKPKTKGGAGGHQGKITVPKSSYKKGIKKSKSIPNGLLGNIPGMSPSDMQEMMRAKRVPPQSEMPMMRKVKKTTAKKVAPKAGRRKPE